MGNFCYLAYWSNSVNWLSPIHGDIIISEGSAGVKRTKLKHNRIKGISKPEAILIKDGLRLLYIQENPNTYEL